MNEPATPAEGRRVRRLTELHPRRHREITHWDDGRGVYFDDPNGHLLEIITRPYGSGGTEAKHPHPLIASRIEAP